MVNKDEIRFSFLNETYQCGGKVEPQIELGREYA